jgi:quercetin dioxygenase-like cupin family protein
MNEEQLLAEAPPFAIFRRADAHPEDGIGIMRQEPMTPTAIAGGTKVTEAGGLEGTENRLLFAGGGFSLSYAWFKSGFPLPRHSHDTDCLYYVLAGTLKMGRETLEAGDGFFIGGGTPYTYTPGPEGVEVLEFRSGGLFNIRMLADNPAFWDKALATVQAQRAAWARESRPSGLD